MPHGSCFCGAIRIEYTGEPLKTGLCHCSDCRKITGSLFTYSFVVRHSEIHISGTGVPKELFKTADSGNRVVNYHCAECGSPLYGGAVGADGAPDGGIVALRAGIFDDVEFLERWKPDIEVYTKKRLGWVKEIEGAEQYECMLALSTVKV
ncbi:Mss4-like protein [Aspergillus granulosus]|uniref:Mss4-like protein n=1 Tax=Aspergillus granulosus TaxID=176169 RepID=A0ABR4H8C9_9EURO